MSRWRKRALPSRLFSLSTRLSVDNSEQSALRNELMDCVSVCVDRLSGRVEGLSCFVGKIKELKKEIIEENPRSSNPKRRASMIEDVVGRVDDVDVGLRPPQGIRNKGCGTNRRLIGPGEKAVVNAKKAPRYCRTCNELGYHDTRNCKKLGKDGASSSHE
jgi:hypothetical protein